MPPNPRPGSASRGEAGRTYLGWQHAVLLPPPGPAPRRPAPADAETVGEEWIAAQRDSEARTNRPLHAALAGLAVFALLCLLLWALRILPGVLAVGGVLACAAIAAPVGLALVQSRQVVAQRLARARELLEAEREERDRSLHEQQREHAREYTEWQAACRAYEAQPLWHGVTVPPGTGTVVVLGGTDAGWSALLATVGASRLREGGDLTVVDLTGRPVSRELVRLARRCAVAPRRWVLPADLPLMTLGTNLDAGQRARVLSAVAAASGPAEDVDADETLLLRLLEVLGPQAGVAELIGGLRALITPEDDAAEDDPALALLDAGQRARARERCADVAWERAWELERRLAPFEAVGTRAEDDAYAQVKIISMDRASGETAARVYGTYAVASLSELLEVPRSGPSAAGGHTRRRPARTRTVVVCGADALPAEEVEQVVLAARESGVEVVLMFRSPVPAALARFGTPDCLPVVMRQEGEAAEEVARAVAALPGAADPDPANLLLHRLTEAVGEAVGESATAIGDDPDAEVADDDRFFPSPHTESGAVIRNAASVAPLDLVRHVRSATAWGRATAEEARADAPLPAEGDGGLRARPHGLDAGALRSLPPTAAVVLGPAGPVLADTNPGILTLSTATLATVDDSRRTGDETAAGRGGAANGNEERGGWERPRTASPDASADPPAGVPAASPGVDAGPDRVPPNLGPPPERLDWRVRPRVDNEAWPTHRPPPPRRRR
ncbi:hypothetical protein [Nocardiopsis algeriensis]|uniref:Uncharacterized protein n=1 Tax=Nocardiopsis algeriensis TaxID=1478215 RepID=A0A841IHN9_9ACTN|nr:hypothetical protein [Nocardiopsis algeriensis]